MNYSDRYSDLCECLENSSNNVVIVQVTVPEIPRSK